MTDVDRLVQDYLAMWNEPDPAIRRQLVERTLTADATYLDPVMSGEGTDAISTMIGVAQAQFPGTGSLCTPGRTHITTACVSAGRSRRTEGRRWRSARIT